MRQSVKVLHLMVALEDPWLFPLQHLGIFSGSFFLHLEYSLSLYASFHGDSKCIIDFVASEQVALFSLHGCVMSMSFPSNSQSRRFFFPLVDHVYVK